MPLKQPPKKGESRLIKVVLSYEMLRDIDKAIERRAKEVPPSSRSEIIRVALHRFFLSEKL